MNLEEFVSQTLVQIIRGSLKAQNELTASVRIFPLSMRPVTNDDGVTFHAPHRDVQNVEFDVQLTVEESSGKSGNAGVGIKVFSAGLNSESKQNTQSTSRVKFSVPMLYDPA